MDTQHAYEELGLHPNASDAELKATWRRLVATWHPDRNAAHDAERRMQLINKAYQHIRKVRDGDDLSDDRSKGDGNAEGNTAASPEAEVHVKTHTRKVRLSIEDAILGCTRTLRGQFAHICDACVGTGHRVFAQACGTCHGSGAVRRPKMFGWLWNDEPCEDCGADGRQRVACDACDGKGEKAVAYRKMVRFPAGLRDGNLLSLPTFQLGEIEIFLELQVELEPHPLFNLDPDGVLRCEVPVNGYAWMAGRWVEVPTPDGMQQMRLSRDALVYRLRGQGFPSAPRGPRGDYFVKITPVFPRQEDTEQEALIDKLIERSTKMAQADKTQPLAKWQTGIKRWNNKRRGRADL